MWLKELVYNLFEFVYDMLKLLVEAFMPQHEPTNTPPGTPEDTQNGAQTTPPQAQNTQENQGIDTLVPWNTKENCRHNVRVICDQEGLTWEQKEDLSATVHCESNYNPLQTHPNVVNGRTTSTDYGICQVNDYFHIGPGKDFPSIDFVLNNPEACIRWMAREWKAGRGSMWVCYSKGMYKEYSA